MSATTCPSREELFDYVVGRLSDDASAGVAEHLEACEVCQAGLATFDDADDTLVARLRLPAAEDPYGEESQCGVAVARARAVAGRPVPPAPEAAAPPTSQSGLLGRLGEYQLLEKLGRGGMGTVYQAIHTKLDRVVALKVLPRSRADDDRAIARFEREMKAIGRLDHPNIVRAYDAREIEGRPVLIMEYVEGLDLGKLVRRLGPLPLGDACGLARQAALGLQYAHENGLVHRDVKPSNLMLTPEGELKILDLGLARFHRPEAGRVAEVEGRVAEGRVPGVEGRVAGVERSSPPAEHGVAGVEGRVAGVEGAVAEVEQSSPPAPQAPGTVSDEMTGSGQAMGTADYMAPEQASDSHAVDIRADIYSLGCTLYKLLTGHAPFSGAQYKGSFEKMTAHVREPVPPIRELDPDIPDELAAVLDRMLAKEPDERFATPAEVAAALGPFCIDCDLPGLVVRAEEAEAAEPPSPALPRPGAPGAAESPPTPLPFWRRWKLVAAAIGLMLLCLGGGIALGIIITIERDGKRTTVEVADGSSVKVDKAGNLSVTPPGETGKPAPAAGKSDLEAIQGMWEVVRASTGRGGTPLVQVAHADLTEQELIGIKVVITSDALKVQGKNVLNFTFEYQLNSRANPRMIDLKAGSRVLWGIYELSSDQLKICTTHAVGRRDSPPRRPTQFWAGYQSGDDLVVLRRVGEAIVTADEKAIQGTWEIVSSENKISESAKTGASLVADSMWPSGDAGIGRKVEITRHDFKLSVPQPPGRGGGGEEQRKEYGYAIDPSRQPKAIDFTFSRVYPGVYELDGDQLRICASIIAFPFGGEDPRPKSIPAKPGDDQVLIVLRRVEQAAEPDAEAILGTWEVVSASGDMGIVVPHANATAEDLKGTRVEITGDTVGAWGEHAYNTRFKYRLNPTTDPKTIDLTEADARGPTARGGVVMLLGLYELTDDQLKICSSLVRDRFPETIRRPAGMSVESGRRDQVVVLKRVGSPEALELRGRWEIVRCAGELPYRDVFYRFGEELKGRQISITRTGLGLVPLTKKGADGPRDRAEGLVSWHPKYTIDPSQVPKTIDLVLDGTTWLGIYKREGAQLTICLGKTRPTAFEAKPGEDRALIVMQRVREPWVVPDALALQGTWAIELMVDKGRQVPKDEDDIRGTQVVIAGDRFIILRGQRVLREHRLRLDPRTQPAKTMDWLMPVAPGAQPPAEGAEEGAVVVRGIYELEGDRLRICQEKGGRGRPTRFPSEPYSPEDILIVLKRIGPAPEKLPPPPRPGSPAYPAPPGEAPAQPGALTPGAAAPAAPAEVIEVQVDKDGQVRLDGRRVSVDPSAPWLAELRQRVAGGAAVRVEVQCDPAAAYRHVAALTEALQAAGVRGVSICGAESTVRPPVTPAQLSFRIAPTRGGKGKPAIDQAEIDRYSQQLQAKGPKAGRDKGAPLAWFELKGDAEESLITANYQGRRYVLLATTPDEVMLPEDEGERAWKLSSAGLSPGPPGLRDLSILLRTDRAGEDRLFVLTATHRGQPLAILLDDQVVSARTITSKFNLAEIRGRFSNQELQRMYFALQAGILERRFAALEAREKPDEPAGPPAAPARKEEKEATSAPRGMLDLRIAPSRGGHGWAVLDEATIKYYLATVDACGRQERYRETVTDRRDLSGLVRSIGGVESAGVLYAIGDRPEGQLTLVSVDVKMVGARPLDDELVKRIQSVVAGGLVGVDSNQVRVNDLSTGATFLGDPSGRRLRSGSFPSGRDPRLLERMRRQGLQRSLGGSILKSLAGVPGVGVTVGAGKRESDPFTVLATVPRSYFEMLWHRRNPAAEGQQPRTAPQEELDEIQRDVSGRIRRYIAAQLPETEAVADPSGQVTLSAIDDDRSWVTLEQMAKKWIQTARVNAYGWFELEAEPAADLITADSQGRRYVLLSRQRGQRILAFDRPAPGNWEVKSILSGKDPQGRPVIEVELNEAGARRLAVLSEVFRGSRLAILVDDKVIATPMLEAKLTDKLQIHGDFDEQEAQRLVGLLQAGMISHGETDASINPLDVLDVAVAGTVEDAPIDDLFLVEPDGQITLGAPYGRIQLKGMSLEEAEEAIERQLRELLREPKVQVTAAGQATRWQLAEVPQAPYRIHPGHLLEIRARGALSDAPIKGTYTVEANGKVALGPRYGRVHVQSLTLEGAEDAIETHLKQYLREPHVSVSLAGWKTEENLQPSRLSGNEATGRSNGASAGPATPGIEPKGDGQPKTKGAD